MMTSRNDRFLKGGFSGLMIAAAILCGAFAVTAFLPVNVVFVILTCAVAGIVQVLIMSRRDKK